MEGKADQLEGDLGREVTSKGQGRGEEVCLLRAYSSVLAYGPAGVDPTGSGGQGLTRINAGV